MLKLCVIFDTYSKQNCWYFLSKWGTEKIKLLVMFTKCQSHDWLLYTASCNHPFLIKLVMTIIHCFLQPSIPYQTRHDYYTLLPATIHSLSNFIFFPLHNIFPIKKFNFFKPLKVSWKNLKTITQSEKSKKLTLWLPFQKYFNILIF